MRRRCVVPGMDTACGSERAPLQDDGSTGDSRPALGTPMSNAGVREELRSESASQQPVPPVGVNVTKAQDGAPDGACLPDGAGGWSNVRSTGVLTAESVLLRALC